MVNIMDTDPEKLLAKYKDADMLETLFKLVKESIVGAPYEVDLDTRVGQAEWKKNLFNLTEELFEAANVLKSRDWVQTEYPIDHNHLADELADAIWFFVRLLMLSGYNAKSSLDLLARKVLVNNFRRRSGY